MHPHPPCRWLVVNAGFVFSLLTAPGVHAVTELRDAELVASQSLAWIADPGNGTVYDDPNGKASFHYVRAVRAGSCH